MNKGEQLDYFRSQLEHCVVCPRKCGVNRLKGELGLCQAGGGLKVASCVQHTGEEPPISGSLGSGTVFLSHCNMACVYCQNYPISQLGHGNRMGTGELAARMLELERSGAHNINLVTPIQYWPQIVEAVIEARDQGLKIPIVSNSSGYETVETVKMLEGIVQVYLVDMRYATAESAQRYSGAADYPHHNRLAVREMLRQVGHIVCKGDVAERGVIVRHLLLPTLLAETRSILEFIAEDLSRETAVSLMSQYFPANRAREYPEINRRITYSERDEAIQLLEEYGLENGWVQEPDEKSRPVA